MKTLIYIQDLYYQHPCEQHFNVMRSSYPLTLFLYYSQHLQSDGCDHVKDTRTSHTTISQQRNDIIIGENFSSENQYQQYLKYLQQWTNPGCYLLLTWDSCSFGVRTNCAGMFKILHVVLYQGWCGYLSMTEHDCKFDDKSVFELSLSR